ncbi:hypothetical protein BGZ51_001065, partial [Haplosporangium sp. Z 767]
FKDSPELTFDKLNVDKEDLPLEIVLRIINFRRDFKEFYMRHLSAVLFDDMVQYYAKGALRKAGFASHFKHELDKYDRSQRDWHAVKKCINKVLNVETLRGKIIQALFNVSPKASEHVFAFCNRVELLFEATETEDNQAQLFIEALVATLPDRFKQDVQAVTNGCKEWGTEEEEG